MDLGREVMDKQMLDKDMRRCGKVDDLLLEIQRGKLPKVSAILAQQGALARDLGPWALWLSRLAYRILGVENPHPVIIDWNLVQKIDVVVHLAKTRHDLGLDRLQHVWSTRIVSKIPGA